MDLQNKLEKIRQQIEICKKNAIKEIQEETMMPATHSLLEMRDLKEQELFIKDLIKEE